MEKTTNVLTENEIKSRLDLLSGWHLDPSGQITKSLEFQDFNRALTFVNAVGHFAELENHHPDIEIKWKQVRLNLKTHGAGGVTERDFRLAREIDLIPD